jgi:hypothetical protein
MYSITIEHNRWLIDIYSIQWLNRFKRYSSFGVLTMISLYLNRFFDRFFAFYASLCRKFRATNWSNFCAIWSTGWEVIALFVIFRGLFSIYLSRIFDRFVATYIILCRKFRATSWSNFRAIWPPGSEGIALLLIFRRLFSIYLNRFFDRFCAIYITLCRKPRATCWSNFCTIWSTGSRDIALFVISCSFLLLFCCSVQIILSLLLIRYSSNKV